MTPTPKLRFVERDQYVGLHEVRTVRILQQWYESEEDGVWLNEQDYVPDGEWRDIPLEIQK